MSESIPAFYVRLTTGRLGPAWDVDTAIRSAYEAEIGGQRKAILIEQAGEVVVHEADLRAAIRKLAA